MKKGFLFLLFVTLLSPFAHAQMKCAPGKCGGGMSSADKQHVKRLYRGNTAHKAIEIKAGEYSCATCNMDVKALDYAVQAVTENGDTYFFDDMGCLLKWLKSAGKKVAKVYVRTLDTHRWIEAQKAHYSRIAPSPMGYGFGAVEADKAGLVSYETVQALMAKGETLRDPAVKKKLLAP